MIGVDRQPAAPTPLTGEHPRRQVSGHDGDGFAPGPGLPGVTIFVDASNGQLDPGSRARLAALGLYTRRGADGTLVREVVPAGFRQTTPNPGPITVVYGRARSLPATVDTESPARPAEPAVLAESAEPAPPSVGGTIAGVKFEDGIWRRRPRPAEPGLGARPFVDANGNGNGRADLGEVHTTSPGRSYTPVAPEVPTWCEIVPPGFERTRTPARSPPAARDQWSTGNRRLRRRSAWRISDRQDRRSTTAARDLVTPTLTVRNLGGHGQRRRQRPLLVGLEFVRLQSVARRLRSASGWSVGADQRCDGHAPDHRPRHGARGPRTPPRPPAFLDPAGDNLASSELAVVLPARRDHQALFSVLHRGGPAGPISPGAISPPAPAAGPSSPSGLTRGTCPWSGLRPPHRSVHSS